MASKVLEARSRAGPFTKTRKPLPASDTIPQAARQRTHPETDAPPGEPDTHSPAARVHPKPRLGSQQEIPHPEPARLRTKPKGPLRALETHSPAALSDAKPKRSSQQENPHPGDGHSPIETRLACAVVGHTDPEPANGPLMPEEHAQALETHSPAASRRPKPLSVSQQENPHPGDGQMEIENHASAAVVGHSSTHPGEGQVRRETQTGIALVGSITIECRRYEDLRRARQRLDLQAKAMCRYACDGDKTAGAKLYTTITKNPDHPLAVWLIPYFAAMAPLDAAIKTQEAAITKLARQLPVWPWVATINGISPRFLGLVTGECAAPIGSYKSVSAVWKRMGLAVIEGARQRRVTGDAAIIHGYVARRRALMWNIGESIIKAQIRNPKGDDGKPIGTAHAIGALGQVYLDRKAYEAERTDKPIIAHARAKRYMEKRFLRELYAQWRRETP